MNEASYKRDVCPAHLGYTQGYPYADYIILRCLHCDYFQWKRT